MPLATHAELVPLLTTKAIMNCDSTPVAESSSNSSSYPIYLMKIIYRVNKREKKAKLPLTPL